MPVDDTSATRLGGVTHAGPSTASSFDEGGFTPGTVLQDRYRIVGLIGRGGMGEVYRAQDLKLGQAVALKFLPHDMGRDHARLERFLGEVRIARQISHPNVCRVYDVGDVDGRHFLSMEFVDGEDLASLLRRIGRLPPDKGTEIARQVCAGLAAAHDRGVLHRDLKPANIMIDGRGHARLADFGLAAAGGDVRAGDVAGTPAYMAPEQLEGQELSTKSDIYALGLVLHELFTGKRVFDGASIQELRDQHRNRSGSQSTLTSGVLDLDPAIDRVIRRCLEPEARNRPPSALAVAAALPGGDPLAAALAAGETPSPELVAQAGTEGTLTPAVAWGLIAATVLGLIATAWLGDQILVYRLLAGMRSPEVLAARAEDLLDTIGYGPVRSDRVYGLRRDFGLVGHVRQHDQGRDRWDRLASIDAGAVRFWYRQSPAPLVPADDIFRPGRGDPPPLTPGMAEVELTSRGRLMSLRAVPPEGMQAARPAGAADWSALFKAAGIDAATLTSTSPARTPPMFADTVAAWDGRYPGRPDWTMRVEAASYQAKPVWFVVAGPWERSPGPGAAQGGGPDVLTLAALWVQVGIGVTALLVGGLLARRNTRSGRADRRGAAIVGVCASVSLFGSIVLGNHYTGGPFLIWNRLIIQIALALYWGAVIWVDYLALEPFVRRRWPEAMISWTRLLAGRFGDPLVARDILVGCVAGLAICMLGHATNVLPEWLGQPPSVPQASGSLLRSLTTLGLFASEIARRPARMLIEGFVMLVVLLIGQAVFRNRWMATVAVIATYIVVVFDRNAVVPSIVGPVILVGILMTIISRFGVLSYMAAWFIFFTILDLPLSLDQTAWYASRGAMTAAMILGVAGWAFYRSLGGRTAFGNAFD